MPSRLGRYALYALAAIGLFALLAGVFPGVGAELATMTDGAVSDLQAAGATATPTATATATDAPGANAAQGGNGNAPPTKKPRYNPSEIGSALVDDINRMRQREGTRPLELKRPLRGPVQAQLAQMKPSAERVYSSTKAGEGFASNVAHCDPSKPALMVVRAHPHGSPSEMANVQVASRISQQLAGSDLVTGEYDIAGVGVLPAPDDDVIYYGVFVCSERS